MLKETLIFVAGIGIGCAASVAYLKPKYDERLNRDIEDLDRVYRSKYGKNTPAEETQEYTEQKEEPIKKSDVEKANEIIQKNDYTAYSKEEAPVKKEPELISIISEDQYDYDHEYDKNSLLWHSDNILVDDIQGIKIDDSDELVGTDFVKEFDDPDVDVVYVRNEKVKIDFEIARDLRSYAEMVEKGFYQG